MRIMTEYSDSFCKNYPLKALERLTPFKMKAKYIVFPIAFKFETYCLNWGSLSILVWPISNNIWFETTHQANWAEEMIAFWMWMQRAEQAASTILSTREPLSGSTN